MDEFSPHFQDMFDPKGSRIDWALGSMWQMAVAMAMLFRIFWSLTL